MINWSHVGDSNGWYDLYAKIQSTYSRNVQEQCYQLTPNYRLHLKLKFKLGDPMITYLTERIAWNEYKGELALNWSHSHVKRSIDHRQKALVSHCVCGMWSIDPMLLRAREHMTYIWPFTIIVEMRECFKIGTLRWCIMMKPTCEIWTRKKLRVVDLWITLRIEQMS